MSARESGTTEYVGPRALRLDLPMGQAQPSWWRWILGTIVAVLGSLLVCFALAKIVSSADPSIAGYPHFEFSDYSRLTIIGVLGACIGWPIVTLFSTTARRIYLGAAIIVVVVSFAPDLWILHQQQPLIGVATLALMHIGLGLVTYPAMVFIAPQRLRKTAPRSA
jgi:hypothetical protein